MVSRIYVSIVRVPKILTYLRIGFFILPKLRNYNLIRLIDGAARIFPTTYAATGNQTHVSSFAHLSLRPLNSGRFTN